MDNNELISAIRNSSERAFQIVFNKYYQGLVRFACSYTENSDAAENIVQDSFVVLWEKREILEEDSNLHALLVQIVKLKVWNYIEKQRRRVLVEKSLYDNAVREMNLKLYTLDSINTTSLYKSYSRFKNDPFLAKSAYNDLLNKLNNIDFDKN